MKTVYGLRNCSCGCKGLVSGVCYRYAYGQRRQYFSNRACVTRHMRKQLRKHPVLHPSNAFLNREVSYFIKHHLERVNVKQPKP